MYNYASHYYAKAALSKPYDSRMWCAMGNCYDKMNKPLESAKCHERAMRFKDKEAIALHKLAKLYIQQGDYKKAEVCFKENLTRRNSEQV
mmetsp:Transcript_5636/g.4030  ORF Transcript_5636/g.4030 Transcript_5636/m.4030 type:complete len:90 (+) Transcript_5636:1420-1689(+)